MRFAIPFFVSACLVPSAWAGKAEDFQAAGVPRTCHSVLRRLQRAAPASTVPGEVLRALLSDLYGHPKRWIPLESEADPFTLQTRSTLAIATRTPNFAIPEAMAQEIEAAEGARKDRIRRLEEQNNILAETLGESYRPGYYVAVLDAIEAVRNASHIAAGTRYLDPLVQLVYSSSTDFLTATSQSALLDEAQGVLLARVGEHLRAGRFLIGSAPGSIREAVRALAVSAFRTYTDALNDEALDGLRAIAGQSRLDPEERLDFLENVSRVEDLGRQLRATRKRYSANYLAARVAFDLLSLAARPDGNKLIESGNILRRSWVSTRDRIGDSFPVLRDLIYTYLNGSSSLWHPGLKEPVPIQGGNIRKALRSLPLEEANALLLGQIHTQKRMDIEANQGLEGALLQEQEEMRAALREKDLAKIDAKLTQIAKASVDTAMKSPVAGRAAAGMMKEVLSVLAEKEAAALDPADPASPIGQISNLPDNLPQFINAKTIQMPWLAGLPGTPPPEATPADSVFTYFTRTLDQLDDRAKALFLADLEMQRQVLNNKRRASSEASRRLEGEGRELLQAVLDLQRSLTACLLQATPGTDRGKALLDADATLAWHLEHKPVLARFVINHANQRALTDLQFRLVLQGLKSGANGKAGDLVEPTEKSIAWKNARIPARIQRHKKRILGLVALIAGSLYWIDKADLWPSFHWGDDAGPPPTAQAQDRRGVDAGTPPPRAAPGADKGR